MGEREFDWPEEIEFRSSVLRLHAAGASVRGIARELGCSQNKVRRRLNGGAMLRRPKGSEVTLDYLCGNTIHNPSTDCLLWRGVVGIRGYGELRIQKKTVLVHRLAWCLANGVRIKDLDRESYILHSCDTPTCVNPEHLTVGSHAENMRQMVQRGRALFGEKNPAAKLTRRDVEEVRRDAPSSTQSALARRFGVSRSTIQRILNGQSRGVA